MSSLQASMCSFRFVVILYDHEFFAQTFLPFLCSPEARLDSFLNTQYGT